MFMLRRRLVAAAAAGVLGLTAVGYAIASSAAARSSGHAAAGGTLTIGDIQAVSSWAADDAQWANQSPFYQAVYDTLLQATPSGVLKPGLATSYTWNKSHTELTLQIRKGVKFTDGSALTASVVALNLNDFKKGQSPNANDLSDMRVAKAAGRYEVRVYLAAPDPALPVYLSQNPGLIESAKGLSSPHANTIPVGSGPYIYQPSQSVPGSSWTFTKNPHYWDPSEQHYSKLVIKYYSTNQAMLDAMGGHQIDYANTAFTPSDQGQVKAAGFHMIPYYLDWYGLMLFDRAGKDAPALANVKVRQAINYAIDRKALLTIENQGQGQITDQIFAPSSPAYEPSLNSRYSYDPTKAKQLMREAGYGNGGITLTFPTVAITPEAVYATVEQNLAAIGIKLNLTPASLSTYITAELTPTWPVTFMALQEDPTPFMVDQFEIAPKASWNPYHNSSPVLNRYLHAVQYAKTTAAATAAAKKVNAFIVDNAWFEPWFRPTAFMVANANTVAPPQSDNADSYLYNITPKA